MVPFIIANVANPPLYQDYIMMADKGVQKKCSTSSSCSSGSNSLFASSSSLVESSLARSIYLLVEAPKWNMLAISMKTGCMGSMRTLPTKVPWPEKKNSYENFTGIWHLSSRSIYSKEPKFSSVLWKIDQKHKVKCVYARKYKFVHEVAQYVLSLMKTSNNLQLFKSTSANLCRNLW